MKKTPPDADVIFSGEDKQTIGYKLLTDFSGMTCEVWGDYQKKARPSAPTNAENVYLSRREMTIHIL